MDSAKLNDWMQVIGIFALVASLIFVGFQMKQTQDIAIASQYHARAEATMNLFLSSLESDYVPVPPLRSQITEEMSARDVAATLWLWQSWDNLYYQYQAGFLEESAWQSVLRNITAVFAVCPSRFVYDWRKNGLRVEFVDMVDSLEDQCASAN